MNLSYCDHANARIRQRGFSESDVELIVSLGTQVEDGAVLLRKQDVDREVRNLEREKQRLHRLKNTKVVVNGETVVTVYRTGKSSQRTTLRRAREGGWSA